MSLFSSTGPSNLAYKRNTVSANTLYIILYTCLFKLHGFDHMCQLERYMQITGRQGNWAGSNCLRIFVSDSCILSSEKTLGAILCRYQTKGAEVSSALFNTFGSSFGWDTKIHSARFRNGCFVQCAVPSLSSSAQPVKSIKIQPQLPVVVQTGGGQSLPMATTGPVPLNMWPHVTAVLHCMGYFDFSLSLTVMHSEHLESSWPLGSRAQHGICETARRNGIFLDPQVEASMLWDCLRLANRRSSMS